MDHTKYQVLKLVLEDDILKLEKEIEVKNKQIATAKQRICEFFTEKYFFWLNRKAPRPLHWVLSVSTSIRTCFVDLEEENLEWMYDRDFVDNWLQARVKMQKLTAPKLKQDNEKVIVILKHFDLHSYVVHGTLNDMYSGLNRIKDRFFERILAKPVEKVSIPTKSTSNLRHINILLQKMKLLRQLLTRKQALMDDIVESTEEFWDKHIHYRVNEKDGILALTKDKRCVGNRIKKLIHFDWLRKLLDPTEIFVDPFAEEKSKIRALKEKYKGYKPKKMEKGEYVNVIRELLFLHEHIRNSEKIINSYRIFDTVSTNTWFLDINRNFACEISAKIDEFGADPRLTKEVGNDFTLRYAHLKKYAQRGS